MMGLGVRRHSECGHGVTYAWHSPRWVASSSVRAGWMEWCLFPSCDRGGGLIARNGMWRQGMMWLPMLFDKLVSASLFSSCQYPLLYGFFQQSESMAWLWESKSKTYSLSSFGWPWMGSVCHVEGMAASSTELGKCRGGAIMLCSREP